MEIELMVFRLIFLSAVFAASYKSSALADESSSSTFPEPTSPVIEPSDGGIVFSSSPSQSQASVVVEATPAPVTPVPPNSSVHLVFAPQVEVYGNNTCEAYHAGSICTAALSPFPLILTNNSRADQTEALQTTVSIFYALQQYGASQQCLEAAIPLLCRYTFPTCDPAYRLPTYQPVCRRDCEIVRDFLCRDPWQEMVRLLELLNFQYLDRPDCGPLRSKEAGESPMCISTLNKGVIPRPAYTGSCYSGYGRGYQGNISVTASGLPCQFWSASGPQQHLFRYENYVELEGDHNFCRNPGERGAHPWCFTRDDNVRWEYCDVPECAAGPSCSSHHSDVCRTQGTIGMDWIYTNTSEATPSQRTEATMSVINHLSTYTASCAAVMTEYLCISNFPSCDLTVDKPRPIMPCRSFCERVRSECGNQIAGLIAFINLISHVYVSLDCDSLPVPSGGDAPECYEQTSTLPLTYRSSSTETDCFNSSDKGISYRGNVSVTSSGKVCQHWVLQEPHIHSITPLDRPELEGHNYCRNPEGRGIRTWCYTSDPLTRWEYCDIPSCSEDVDSGSVVVIASSVSAAGFVCLVMVCAVLLICCCCQRQKRRNFKSETMNFENGSADVTVTSAVCPVYTKRNLDLSDNPLYATNTKNSEHADYDGLKLPEFARENIFYIKDLGQGHFGVVVQAEALGIEPDREKTTVAIKVMKEGVSDQTRKEFFREASLMHTFCHPNIVKLLGVCIEQEPLCMIFEFIELGDLNQFLRQSVSKVQGASSTLSTPQLVCMAIDIASGLEYLAQNHFVHRDLATRNCLVSRDLHVKISDFGLSQDVYTTDYFKMGDSELLPIRWMPPEAILYAKFTVQSDIWSFGVVMWEIFSLGIQPYFSMTNEEVVQHVRNGNVLSCPDECPKDIYDLILDCWVMEPSERPTAAEISDGLRRWSPELSCAGKDGGGSQQPSYQNVAAVQRYVNPPSLDKVANGYDHLEMSGLEGEENQENGAAKTSTCV